MTYLELIAKYPGIEIFLEFFKGIAPTMVALLAIWINNSKAKKRDERNRNDNLLYNVKKEMLDKFSDLSTLQWKCGADLIDYLSETEDEERGALSEKYRYSLYASLYKAQEIFDYYHTMFGALKISIDCNDIVEVSRRYSDKLNDLCEAYYGVYKIKCPKERDKLLDLLRDKVLSETCDVKSWTGERMKEIADSLVNKK